MTPEEIGGKLAQRADQFADRAAEDRATARAAAAILGDLKPVRPLAPAWAYAVILVLLVAAAAVDTSSVLGMAGLWARNPLQRASIFAVLAGAAWLAALACSRAMRPASGRNLAPFAWSLAPVLLASVFALEFDGYSLHDFVNEGLPCLKAGLCVALPTAVAIAVLLRRGFVLNGGAAGLAAGTLAGLAGMAMLELHCPNLKAIHAMVWHTAVVVVSGAVGYIAGRIAFSFGRR